MKSISSRHTTPGGPCAYQQPETGFRAEWVTSWQDFVCKVQAHRQGFNATKKPDQQELDQDPGWLERLEHDFCEQNPRLPHMVDGQAYGRFITIGDLKRFVVTMTKWALAGRPSVTQEEAERRATICAGGDGVPPCPYNVGAGGCFGCAEAGEFLNLVNGGGKTSKDSKLRACGICKCQLAGAKIWMPMEIMDVSGLEFPDFCWQKKTP